MKECTATTLRAVIAAHGGVLVSGSHDPTEDGPCCALEARSVCLGIDWTDSPDKTGMPDIRPINDAPWSSNTVRTEAMIQLTEALSDWRSWTKARRRAWASEVALETVRQIIAELPGLTTFIREQCRDVADLPAAAGAAADAAEAAARAVGAGGAADMILHLACQIWIDAAQHTSTL